MHEMVDRNVYESSDENINDIAKEKQIFDKNIAKIETCKKIKKKEIELHGEQIILIQKRTDAYRAIVLQDEKNGRPSVTNERRLEELDNEYESNEHKLNLLQSQYEKLGCYDH